MSPQPGAAFGLAPHLGQSGSCIVCLRGTDTALAFRGDVNEIAAGLVAIGVPIRDAIATVQAYPPEADAAGPHYTVRVCSTCVRQNAPRLPEPALAIPGAEIPCISRGAA